MKITAKTIELDGSNYEIGMKLGKMTKTAPALRALHTSGFPGFGEKELKEAREMFSLWCPGLNEELDGFADALGVPLEKILYYAMTSLHPNCSQIALLPSMTKEGVPLLARNYEFNPEGEDFTLVRTAVVGKYVHLGTSVLHFGRDDGFNECGLAVTISSCGFPVGPNVGMRQPRIKGLQFWAVIRTVLENCKDVEEALDYVREMPIAYNLNLMLVDKGGHIALVETLDGRMEVQQISEGEGRRYLCATNHPVIPEMIPFEPRAMRHSQQRLEWILQTVDQAGTVDREMLKEMLLSMYPEGLCCHCYQDFFGTTKSMVIDPAHGTIELCWGGERDHGWQTYEIGKPLPYSEKVMELHNVPFEPAMGEYVPLI